SRRAGLGGRRRGVQTARAGAGADVLRPRRERSPAPVAASRQAVDPDGTAAFQRASHGQGIRPRDVSACYTRACCPLTRTSLANAEIPSKPCDTVFSQIGL